MYYNNIIKQREVLYVKEHNSYYWQKKNQRAETARAHMEKMESQYKDEIESSVRGTQVYGVGTPDIETRIKYIVSPTDSVTALFEYAKGITAMLNFASYKNPGGQFLNGSRAQEESLCHESTLYNVLKEFPDFYEWNARHLNNGLYQNRAIYSPDIVFTRNNKTCLCDVITCASPNWSAASHRVSAKENELALRSRIRFVLEIARDNQVNTLILGAFGCGVFQQDAAVVAKMFHEAAEEIFQNYNITLVFAVIPALPGQPDNLKAFQSEFK